MSIKSKMTTKSVILTSIIALVAFSLGISSGIGDPNNPLIENILSQLNTVNPIHIYDINTNCELYYFILKRPIIDAVPISQQEVMTKYPEEYEKIMHVIQTPEYAEYISTHQGTKMPIEMQEAIASIIIKSSSINPILESKLIEAISLESEDALYTKIEKEDPNCAKKIESKLKPERIPAIQQIYLVIKGSSAEKAGLLKGDIITAIDDTPILAPADFAKFHLKANQQVIVSIIRDGKAMKIPVTLDPAKDDPVKGMLGIIRMSVTKTS